MPLKIPNDRRVSEVSIKHADLVFFCSHPIQQVPEQLLAVLLLIAFEAHCSTGERETGEREVKMSPLKWAALCTKSQDHIPDLDVLWFLKISVSSNNTLGRFHCHIKHVL